MKKKKNNKKNKQKQSDVPPAKTQISLETVWSETSLCA